MRLGRVRTPLTVTRARLPLMAAGYGHGRQASSFVDSRADCAGLTTENRPESDMAPERRCFLTHPKSTRHRTSIITPKGL